MRFWLPVPFTVLVAVLPRGYVAVYYHAPFYIDFVPAVDSATSVIHTFGSFYLPVRSLLPFPRFVYVRTRRCLRFGCCFAPPHRYACLPVLVPRTGSIPQFPFPAPTRLPTTHLRTAHTAAVGLVLPGYTRLRTLRCRTCHAARLLLYYLRFLAFRRAAMRFGFCDSACLPLYARVWVLRTTALFPYRLRLPRWTLTRSAVRALPPLVWFRLRLRCFCYRFPVPSYLTYRLVNTFCVACSTAPRRTHCLPAAHRAPHRARFRLPCRRYPAHACCFTFHYCVQLSSGSQVTVACTVTRLLWVAHPHTRLPFIYWPGCIWLDFAVAATPHHYHGCGLVLPVTCCAQLVRAVCLVVPRTTAHVYFATGSACSSAWLVLRFSGSAALPGWIFPYTVYYWFYATARLLYICLHSLVGYRIYTLRYGWVTRLLHCADVYTTRILRGSFTLRILP